MWSGLPAGVTALRTTIDGASDIPVKDRSATERGVYRLPIYKILSRAGVLATTGHSTNFVMWMEVPSNRTDIVNNVGDAGAATLAEALARGALPTQLTSEAAS